MVAGWIAVLVALLALAPGFVPGAMSVIGLLLSLAAVPLCLLSIRSQGKRYFHSVVAIVAVGTLLVNDGLRIWSTTPMPTGLYIALLALTVAVIGVCFAIAGRLSNRTAHP